MRIIISSIAVIVNGSNTVMVAHKNLSSVEHLGGLAQFSVGEQDSQTIGIQ
jgi:hypothetical protein